MKRMHDLSAYISGQAWRVKRKVRTLLKRARYMSHSRQSCPACGQTGRLITNAVLWPDLIAEWELSSAWADWIDEREGRTCEHCGSNLRSRQLALALVSSINNELGTTASCLHELCNSPRVTSLDVAEINFVGGLHTFLKKLPQLRYSEFGSKEPGVPSEDLMCLSYPDATFDLVITSDTLEHVPDIDVALGEISRVLKPSGMHIFTVPVVWDRPATRQRAIIDNGKVVHLLPPSSHGAKDEFLVFYEFGADFIKRCEEAGFKVDLIRDEKNPSLVTFITRRSE